MITRYFPDAPALYAKRNWRLPTSIGRIYDPGRAERILGFRGETDFAQILAALRADRPPPFIHDPAYRSPTERFAPHPNDQARPTRHGAA